MKILNTLAHHYWPDRAASPAIDTLRSRIDRLPPAQREAAEEAWRLLARHGLFHEGGLNLVGAAHGVPRVDKLLDALLTLHATRVLPLNQPRFRVHAGSEAIETDFAGFIAFHAMDTTDHAHEPTALQPAQILDSLERAGLLQPTTLPARCRSALHLAIDRPDGAKWVAELLRRGFQPLRQDHTDGATTLQVALTRPLCSPATRRALLDGISPAQLLRLPTRLQRPILADLMRHQSDLFRAWLVHAINQPDCPGKLRTQALKTVMHQACARNQPLSPTWVASLIYGANPGAAARRFMVLGTAAIKTGNTAVLEKLCRHGLPIIAAMQPGPFNPRIADARCEFLLYKLLEESLSAARHDITLRLLSEPMTQLAGERGVPITPELLLAACTSRGTPPAVLSRLCQHMHHHGFCWQSPAETGDQRRILLQQHGHALRELLRAENRHWRRYVNMAQGGLMVVAWQCMALLPMITGGGQSPGLDQSSRVRAGFAFLLTAALGAALLYRVGRKFEAIARNEALISRLE